MPRRRRHEGGHGDWPRLAILAFICGAAAPGYILTVPHASERARTIAELIAVETILVAAAGIAMLLLVRGAWTGMTIIALLAFAVGLQNATSTYLLSPTSARPTSPTRWPTSARRSG
jgi:hypothetical protein